MGKSYGEIFQEMFTMPNVQWPDVWQAILETLYMTIVSTIFAFIFCLIPISIFRWTCCFLIKMHMKVKVIAATISE